jgi:hypothetical protein
MYLRLVRIPPYILSAKGGCSLGSGIQLPSNKIFLKDEKKNSSGGNKQIQIFWKGTDVQRETK